MEFAYHDRNRREYEMPFPVSLRQLDPIALLELQCTGSCDFTIPEWLFAKSYPSNYLMRIKSLAVSIPSVVGPDGVVNCKVTLLQSKVRSTTTVVNTFDDDNNYVTYPGGVSIQTGGGSNDSGMFVVNLHDERFLPFEGAGVISSWRLELPSTYPAFDFSTIPDVILHFRYTAREGGDTFAKTATEYVQGVLGSVSGANLAQLFLLKSDFPTEWAAFAANNADLTIPLTSDDFPYFTQGHQITPSFDLYYYSAGDAQPTKAANAPQATGNINGGTVSVKIASAGDNKVAAADHAFLVVSYSLK